MEDIDRKKLAELKQFPGWQVFVQKMLPEKIRSLEQRTARHMYKSLDELLLDQARVKVYESLESLVDEFINADGSRSSSRTSGAPTP